MKTREAALYTVRVKDRGRDLVVHQTDRLDEAEELARVYQSIGYPADKVLIDRAQSETPKAA
jgi:hypothetical protein